MSRAIPPVKQFDPRQPYHILFAVTLRKEMCWVKLDNLGLGFVAACRLFTAMWATVDPCGHATGAHTPGR